ncbi:hypothetical protein [Paraburkholderia sp. DHOC27]|uniref:hypothetical protein n=1 Tax=Paraburkholderia sp. DHOC27 TaxID=2303330 RepID=UPI000E3CDA31|nr:hypothetical protein [Paraburkholderia sp. DHOC27]RFU46506.1 hypothetical protein D0B32_15895 [Paraburkholderia sp. DHOC27]
MKIRTLSIACGTTVAVLLAGCTSVYSDYKNSSACEQLMRSKLADVTSEQLPYASLYKLSTSHTGTGIAGSRVVVEGSLSRMQTAAEVAKANAPKGASGASATAAASGAGVASAASGTAVAGVVASGGVASDVAATDVAASDVTASGAAVANASAASAASATTVADAKPAKPIKPKKVIKGVAVECTFSGPSLTSFRWLSPAELVKTNETDKSDTTE